MWGSGRPELHHACYLVARAFPGWPPCSKGGVNLCGWRSGGRRPGLGPKHRGCKAGARGVDGSQGGSVRSGLGHVTQSGNRALQMPGSLPAPPSPSTSRAVERVHRAAESQQSPKMPVSHTASQFSSRSLVALEAAPRGRPGEHKGRGGGLGLTQGHPVGAGTQSSQSAGGWWAPLKTRTSITGPVPPAARSSGNWLERSL